MSINMDQERKKKKVSLWTKIGLAALITVTAAVEARPFLQGLAASDKRYAIEGWVKGYDVCFGKNEIGWDKPRPCIDAHEMKEVLDRDIPTKTVNPLIPYTGHLRRPIRDLYDWGCLLEAFPENLELFIQAGMPDRLDVGAGIISDAGPYALDVICGETTVDEVLAFDERYRTPPHTANAGTLAKWNNVSPETANSYPQIVPTGFVTECIKRNIQPETAARYWAVEGFDCVGFPLMIQNSEWEIKNGWKTWDDVKAEIIRSAEEQLRCPEDYLPHLPDAEVHIPL